MRVNGIINSYGVPISAVGPPESRTIQDRCARCSQQGQPDPVIEGVPTVLTVVQDGGAITTGGQIGPFMSGYFKPGFVKVGGPGGGTVNRAVGDFVSDR